MFSLLHVQKPSLQLKTGAWRRHARRSVGASMPLIGLVLFVGAGCAPPCPLDGDANGTITEDELTSFSAGTVSLDQLVRVEWVGCLSQMDQISALLGPSAVNSQPTGPNATSMPTDQSPVGPEDPPEPLSGVWRFNPNNGGTGYSPFETGLVWHPTTHSFHFDASGDLIDVVPPGPQSNDPLEAQLEWHDVSFSGHISETGASIQFSGRCFQPRWSNISQLESDESYFNPAETASAMTNDDKAQLVANVGWRWSYEMHFETSTEPAYPREGPAETVRNIVEIKPLIICTNGGCALANFYEEAWPEQDARLWTSLYRSSN